MHAGNVNGTIDISRDLVRNGSTIFLDRSFPLNFCGVERVTAEDYTTLHISFDSLRKPVEHARVVGFIVSSTRFLPECCHQ